MPARGHHPSQQINRALHRIPVFCKKKFGDAPPFLAQTMAAASTYHSIDHVRANIDQLVRACTDVPTGLTRLLLGLPLSNQAVTSLADETKKTAIQLKLLVAIKKYMTEDGQAELLDAVNDRFVPQNGILMTGLAPPS